MKVRELRLTALLCLAVGLGAAQEPNKRMLDDPLNFSGPESQRAELADLDELRIGLFAPGKEDPVGASLIDGAALAVDRANALGGVAGVPITIVRRWAPDPWSGGAREMVRLVYEDRVWAVIGSVNGDATHVAQQVVTKAHVALVAPVSADPSLTHTRVPWIFRLPPDDQSQAELIAAGLLARGLKRVGMVTGTDHDSRTVAAELVKAMERAGRPPVFRLEIGAGNGDYNALAQRISAFEADALVLRTAPKQLSLLLHALEENNLCMPVFLPWIPGLCSTATDQWEGINPSPTTRQPHVGAGFTPARVQTTIGDETGSAPSSPRCRCLQITSIAPFAAGEAHAGFATTFRERFDRDPDPVAAYAYDAANLLIEALRAAGPSRIGVRDHLATSSGYKGVTGTILWDTGGGNRGEPVLGILPF